jgi:tetratricopeptide (TPR) repeat protein
VERARRLAADGGDDRLAAWSRVLASRIATFTRTPDELTAEQLAELAATFTRHEDAPGLQRIERLRAGAAWAAGRMTEAAEHFGAAAQQAEAAGELAEAARQRQGQLDMMTMGPARASQVAAFAESELAKQPNRTTAALLSLNLAAARAAEGRLQEARDLIRAARNTLREMGLRTWAEISGQIEGHIELLAGEPRRARDVLEASREGLIGLGERAYLSTTSGVLANLYCDLGNFPRALELSRESEQASDPDDVASEAFWRAARARVLAQSGSREEARALMAEAIRLIFTSEMLELQGMILEASADLASVEGDVARHVEDLQRAAALYERKGNRASASRVRAPKRRGI